MLANSLERHIHIVYEAADASWRMAGAGLGAFGWLVEPSFEPTLGEHGA
jgi:hypothetical protein